MAEITAKFRPIPENDRKEKEYSSGFFRCEILTNSPPEADLVPSEFRLLESFVGQPEETASRLLSKLIMAALPAFYVMLCGPLNQIAKRYWEFETPPELLTEEQRAEVLQKIDQIADIINFKAETFDQSSRGGQTRLLHDVTSIHFPRGYGSEITVSKRLYDGLVRCQQRKDPIAFFLHNFEWAEIVLHELAHAVQNTTGKYGSRVFLCPTAQTTEMGFEMEHFTFGFLPRIIKTKKRPFYSVKKEKTAERGILILEEYCFKGLADVYDTLQSFAWRFPPYEIGRIWNLPLSLVVGLHLEQTWADLLVEENPNKLKFYLQPRTGLRKINDAEGKVQYLIPEAGDDLRFGKGLRDGFLLHQAGLMFRSDEDLTDILPTPKVEAPQQMESRSD